MRLLSYSLEKDGLVLLVTAPHRRALSRGIQGISVRIARAVNRKLERKGRLFADRYDARLIADASAEPSAANTKASSRAAAVRSATSKSARSKPAITKPAITKPATKRKAPPAVRKPAASKPATTTIKPATAKLAANGPRRTRSAARA